MYVNFLKRNQGPAIENTVPKGKCVYAKFCKQNCLHKLKKYLTERRRATKLRHVGPQHVNASHKAVFVRETGKGCLTYLLFALIRPCRACFFFFIQDIKHTLQEENIRLVNICVQLCSSVSIDHLANLHSFSALVFRSTPWRVLVSV